MVLQAYFGVVCECRGDGQLVRLTLGGVMASRDAIAQLCTDWELALRDEGLREFRAENIDGDHRPGERTCEERHRLARFTDILCNAGVEFGAYSCASQHRAAPFKRLYLAALDRAYNDFASLCAREDKRGHMVFAKTAESNEKLIGSSFELLKWRGHLDGYGVELVESSPALQAAGFVANGMRRLMQDGLITYCFARVLLAGAAPGKQFRSWPENAVTAARELGHEIRLGFGPRDLAGLRVPIAR